MQNIVLYFNINLTKKELFIVEKILIKIQYI